MRLAVGILIFVLLAPTAWGADDVEDLRKDLAVVRSTLGEEFQRRNAAKAEMERSLMFIETRLPLLIQREKELLEKIDKIEKEKKKE